MPWQAPAKTKTQRPWPAVGAEAPGPRAHARWRVLRAKPGCGFPAGGGGGDPRLYVRKKAKKGNLRTNPISNPLAPCRIGKRPPAPENWPAIGESRGGGACGCGGHPGSSQARVLRPREEVQGGGTGLSRSGLPSGGGFRGEGGGRGSGGFSDGGGLASSPLLRCWALVLRLLPRRSAHPLSLEWADSELKGRWTDPPARKWPFFGVLEARRVGASRCLSGARDCASVDSTQKTFQNLFLARLGWFSAAGAIYLILGTVLKSTVQQPELAYRAWRVTPSPNPSSFCCTALFRPPSGG